MATETAAAAAAAPPPETISAEGVARSGQERSTLGLGTRQSKLALAQVTLAIEAARAGGAGTVEFAVRKQHATADKDKVTALYAFNAKALWTTELEADLAAGATDLIAHSLKDVPTQLPAGMALGAALLRNEARDCVVMSPTCAARGWRHLADLPPGSLVGTSSVRRLAQLRRNFPELRTDDMRGNIDTRLKKLDAEASPFQALILAATGLQRVGLGDRISSFLSRREGGWLGAVGQGAIGIEVREGDRQVLTLCDAMMTDPHGEPEGTGMRTWYECLAERSLLRALEGGCSVPLAVESEWDGGELTLYSLVASLDGKECVEGSVRRTVASVDDAEEAGLELAGVMVEKGAEKILGAIRLNRKLIAESGGA